MCVRSLYHCHDDDDWRETSKRIGQQKISWTNRKIHWQELMEEKEERDVIQTNDKQLSEWKDKHSSLWSSVHHRMQPPTLLYVTSFGNNIKKKRKEGKKTKICMQDCFCQVSSIQIRCLIRDNHFLRHKSRESKRCSWTCLVTTTETVTSGDKTFHWYRCCINSEIIKDVSFNNTPLETFPHLYKQDRGHCFAKRT